MSSVICVVFILLIDHHHNTHTFCKSVHIWTSIFILIDANNHSFNNLVKFQLLCFFQFYSINMDKSFCCQSCERKKMYTLDNESTGDVVKYALLGGVFLYFLLYLLCCDILTLKVLVNQSLTVIIH